MARPRTCTSVQTATALPLQSTTVLCTPELACSVHLQRQELPDVDYGSGSDWPAPRLAYQVPPKSLYM